MAHVLETQNKTCSGRATRARPSPPQDESRPEGQAADPAPARKQGPHSWYGEGILLWTRKEVMWE